MAASKLPPRWDLRPDGRNVAHQYCSTFYEGFDPEDVPFDTLEELFDLPWVKQWSKRPNFHRYSLDRGGKPALIPALMAEFDGGMEWYFVGYLDNDVPELPTWETKYGDAP